MKVYLFILVFAWQSCASQTKETTAASPSASQNPSLDTISQIYKDTVVFLSYNDDGDYRLLHAAKGTDTISFINEKNEDRNLLRGDICAITWNTDTIYISGDGETPAIAEWLLEIKKIKDGSVSELRKKYTKKMKYHYHDEGYSEEYLDQLYKFSEYYIANTSNDLIKLAIQNNDLLEYSIEERSEKSGFFDILGIGRTVEHHFTVLQWIYIDRATQKIYEYDLRNDHLKEFL